MVAVRARPESSPAQCCEHARISGQSRCKSESIPRPNGIVPEQLLQHPAGFLGRVSMNEESPTPFVSQQSDDLGPRLYLVFFSEDVSQLAFYFGILPLSLALLLVYGFSFLTYRLSHRAISPIVKLADYLEEFRFGSYNQPRSW